MLGCRRDFASNAPASLGPPPPSPARNDGRRGCCAGSARGGEAAIVARTRSYFLAHLGEPIRPDDLAANVHLSRFHVAHRLPVHLVPSTTRNSLDLTTSRPRSISA